MEKDPQPVGARVLDAIPRVEYDEWRNHPATKLVIQALREDIAEAEALLHDEAERFRPSFVRLRALGTQLFAKRTMLSYYTERSDD